MLPVLALGWFIWPVVLWRMNVRGWQFFLPVAFGLLAFGTLVTLLFMLIATSVQI
jgi:hypothetical protein